MNQEFRPDRNVLLDTDGSGVVRQVLHTPEPVSTNARTPQLAAADYLTRNADLLGISAAELQRLSLAPSATLEDAPIEYRFLSERQQFDTATVAYYQTDLGLPIWRAGLSVQIKIDPFRILGAQTTRHPEVKVERPSADAVKRAESIAESELARLLGLDQLDGEWNRSSLTVDRRRLIIYRYEAAQRVPAQPSPNRNGHDQEFTVVAPPQPTLPLPAVAPSINDGQHYVCVEIDFALNGQQFPELNWIALVDVETLSVLYLRAQVDSVSGMVFEYDPITTNGGPLPSANNAALNPVRTSVILPGLVPPSGGSQALTGVNVQVSELETPTVASPTEPSGTDFNFNARTNDFAAVNAYYHTDKFIRLVESLGFSRATYFSASSFPTPVDHRGHISSSTGVEINAHCLGGSGGVGILRSTYMLADTADSANPLGIACDYRVVLHELAGHGILYNWVHSANFGFSHSAGDGIAAILGDPGTLAVDRFQTFPWMYNAVNRRHDRTPAGGWGYAGNIGLNPFSGTYDGSGYNNEQLLSSTHFRMYRSLGGDSADMSRKRFAARVTVYLILRAIATLTPATNPSNVTGWIGALQTADLGDWISEGITGGAYGKVIRWAFEKQGAYQPAGAITPNNNAGAPPPVDVYIDDGRAGEYQFQPVWWNCQKVWNRRANDGVATHQEPITGRTNYAYVKIKNRGTQSANGVVVKAFHANPAAGLSYPIDWTPMTTAQLTAPNVAANNASEITVGPFEWIPTHVGHECMFMVVSATGDPSNISNIAAGDAIPEWRLVPNDNNIGQRNVFPISGGGTSGLTHDFKRVQFEVKNPHLETARVEARVVLPAFLERRGWKIEFLNAGGAAFPLAAGERRTVDLRLVPGADFTSGDVASSEDRTIHLYGYAGGMLVGGVSLDIDPNLQPLDVEQSQPVDRECARLADSLLKCIHLPVDQVTQVRVRKVNLDVVFTEPCVD